jgi:hypothetical protein
MPEGMKVSIARIEVEDDTTVPWKKRLIYPLKCKFCKEEFLVSCNQMNRRYCSVKCREDAGGHSYTRTPEFRQRISLLLKGRVVLESTGQKISIANKGRPKSDAFKKRVSIAHTGLHHTAEARRKMSIIQQKIWAIKENREKASISQRGSNGWNWQGGLSGIPYPPKYTYNLRKRIKERDGFQCQLCGVKSKLAVHHIDYDKNNCSQSNLVTLCICCNNGVNFDREKWTTDFQNFMEIKYPEYFKEISIAS